MPDKQYYDASGQPLDSITVPVKQYFDAGGAPLDEVKKLTPAEQITNRVAIRRASSTRGQLPEGKSMLETMANSLAEPAVQTLPMVGSEYGPIGTGIGSFVKNRLQSMLPNVFGQPSQTPFVDAGKDLLFNNAIPGALGGAMNLATAPKETIARMIAKKFPFTNWSPIADSSLAVRRGVAESTIGNLTQGAGSLIQPETQIIESAAGAAGGVQKGLANDISTAQGKIAPPSKLLDANGNPIGGGPQTSPELEAAQEAYKNTFGSKNRVGQALLRLNQEADKGGEAAAQAYKNISNTALSDVTHVRNFKLATGEDNTISQLATQELLGPGTRNGNIDPDAVLGKLKGVKNEIYQEALTPEGYSKVSDLLNAIKTVKTTEPKTINAVIPYGKRLAIGALTSPIIGWGGGTTIAGSLVLGEMALRRVMSTPQMAELVTQALKTPASAPEASLLTKSLLQGLKGTTVVIRSADDKDITATVGPDGQLQYGKPQ